MTRAYEVAIVLDPELGHAELERQQHTLTELFKQHGGTVTDTDVWGRRETAYALKGNKEAFYVFFVVEMAGESVQALDQALRLHEPVLRHLITIQDNEIVQEEEKGKHGDTLTE